jgi:hypothetical protein
MLWATNTTLNIQSFMGAIMAIGIAVANSILLITFAERFRREKKPVMDAVREGASSRLRAILMTAAAMICGMAPMAIGFGEGGSRWAPLGRDVTGSLIIHICYLDHSSFDLHPPGKASVTSPSLNPMDPLSRYYDGIRTFLFPIYIIGLLTQVGRAQTGEFAPVVSNRSPERLTCRVNVCRSWRFASKVAAYVNRVLVDRGSMVKRGDLLIELSAPEMTAQLAEGQSKLQAAEAERLQAEAQLAATQSTYERMKKAAETPGAIAGNELVQTEQQMEAAKALLNSRQQAIRAAE